MNESTVGNIIVKSVSVQCSLEVAFRVWTEQVTVWWPKGHSISGKLNTEVLMEGKIGGRFYERTSDGVEHQWGQITVWKPPHHLAYDWYLGSDPQRPTRVEVRFIAEGRDHTRVEIEHRGPELIGDLWWERNSRFASAWDDLLPQYAVTCSDQ